METIAKAPIVGILFRQKCHSLNQMNLSRGEHSHSVTGSITLHRPLASISALSNARSSPPSHIYPHNARQYPSNSSAVVAGIRTMSLGLAQTSSSGETILH